MESLIEKEISPHFPPPFVQYFFVMTQGKYCIYCERVLCKIVALSAKSGSTQNMAFFEKLFLNAKKKWQKY